MKIKISDKTGIQVGFPWLAFFFVAGPVLPALLNTVQAAFQTPVSVHEFGRAFLAALFITFRDSIIIIRNLWPVSGYVGIVGGALGLWVRYKIFPGSGKLKAFIRGAVLFPYALSLWICCDSLVVGLIVFCAFATTALVLIAVKGGIGRISAQARRPRQAHQRNAGS
jgi:hypothetical protein